MTTLPRTPSPLPAGRIVSIDAFRGLTFTLMLFVNFIAGASGTPQALHHVAASVDGMGLADVVFPAFLFAVGLPIPFSMRSRMARGATLVQVQRHTAYRALALVVMGLFMVNGETGYNAQATGVPLAVWSLGFYVAAALVWGVYRFKNKMVERAMRTAGVALLLVLALVYRGGPDGVSMMAPHWWGILGLIGWAYLVAGLIYQLVRARIMLLLAAIVLSIAAFVLCDAYAVLPGWAAHTGHVAIVLSGVVCAAIFFEGGKRLRDVTLFAVALAGAAWLLHQFYPVSKIGATPPWALYCAAICVAVYAALYWLIEVRGQRRWTAIVEPAASSPLVTYLIPFVLEALMSLMGVEWSHHLRHGAAAMLFALVFSGAVLMLVAGLNRYNIKLKL